MDTQRSKGYTRGLFYPLFLLHRYFFILVVFLFSFSGALQSSLMLLSTALFLSYILKCRPLKQRHHQCLAVLSTLLLLYSYSQCLLFSLLPQSSFPTLRATLGLLFIGVVLLFFFLTLVVILVFQLKTCKKQCRDKKLRKIYQTRLEDFKTKERQPQVQQNTWLSEVDSNWGTVLDKSAQMPVLSAIRVTNPGCSQARLSEESSPRPRKKEQRSLYALALKSSPAGVPGDLLF